MKASQLREFIRPLIQEEVKKQLPKLLFEILGAQTNKQMVRESHSSDDPIEDSIPKNRSGVVNTPKQPQPPKKLKTYVKDPVLNQILNETTPGLPSTSYVDSGVPIPNFSKVGVSDDFMGEMRQILNESESPQPQMMQEEVESTDGPDLSKLFNKDFSAILKKSMSGNIANTGRVALS
jgi:hypothetical protein